MSKSAETTVATLAWFAALIGGLVVISQFDGWFSYFLTGAFMVAMLDAGRRIVARYSARRMFKQ
jgi:uncharacterized membrane protein